MRDYEIGKTYQYADEDGFPDTALFAEEDYPPTCRDAYIGRLEDVREDEPYPYKLTDEGGYDIEARRIRPVPEVLRYQYGE